MMSPTMLVHVRIFVLCVYISVNIALCGNTQHWHLVYTVYAMLVGVRGLRIVINHIVSVHSSWSSHG